MTKVMWLNHLRNVCRLWDTIGLLLDLMMNTIKLWYHFLRHTYGTQLAVLNTPTHLLCNQMGHGNIHVTERYYIALSKNGIDVLRKNLEQL